MRLFVLSIFPFYCTFRIKGIGAEIIEEFLIEANQKGIPFFLKADKIDPAANLNQRLGFEIFQKNEIEY
jgi:hypothetical protein